MSVSMRILTTDLQVHDVQMMCEELRVKIRNVPEQEVQVDTFLPQRLVIISHAVQPQRLWALVSGRLLFQSLVKL